MWSAPEAYVDSDAARRVRALRGHSINRTNGSDHGLLFGVVEGRDDLALAEGHVHHRFDESRVELDHQLPQDRFVEFAQPRNLGELLAVDGEVSEVVQPLAMAVDLIRELAVL